MGVCKCKYSNPCGRLIMKKILIILIFGVISYSQNLMLLPTYHFSSSSEIKSSCVFYNSENRIFITFDESNEILVYLNDSLNYTETGNYGLGNTVYLRNDTIYAYHLYPPDSSEITTEFIKYRLYPDFERIDSLCLDGIYYQDNVFYSSYSNEILTWTSEASDSINIRTTFNQIEFLTNRITLFDINTLDTFAIIDSILNPQYFVHESDSYFYFFDSIIAKNLSPYGSLNPICLMQVKISRDRSHDDQILFNRFCSPMIGFYEEYGHSMISYPIDGLFRNTTKNFSINNITYKNSFYMIYKGAISGIYTYYDYEYTFGPN